tara:strand:+ start:81 stop:1421 length:1341 start_codon:yes stop_codon:yes gene_type:complete
MLPELGLFDFCLAFLYLCLIYFGAFLYKNKKIETHPEYKYFILGLTTKIIGGVGFAVFSIYYYKGGDTFVFFNAAEGLRQTIFSDFNAAIDVFLLDAKNFNPAIHTFSPRYNYILKSTDVLSMVKITSIINLLTFGSYLSSSILFAFFSFLGLWFAYSNFCKLYPLTTKYLIIPFFLIPSAILWSSGILKDTVTIGAIGWILYAFSNLFIFKRKLGFSVFVIIIGSLLLLALKPYILYVLLPCLFIWVQSNLKHLVKGSFVRMLLKPLLILVLGISGYFLTQEFSASAGKYNLENIESALQGFQSWHEYLAENRDQSGYTLGEMELTPFGILKKAPAALNVTFFRPYLWEVRNLPTFLGALEGLVLFAYFLYLTFKLRVSFFKLLVSNKEALFLIIFALVFGVVVGVSSYNFGALSRYKIPAQLFFLLALIIVQYEGKKAIRFKGT